MLNAKTTRIVTKQKVVLVIGVGIGLALFTPLNALYCWVMSFEPLLSLRW